MCGLNILLQQCLLPFYTSPDSVTSSLLYSTVSSPLLHSSLLCIASWEMCDVVYEHMPIHLRNTIFLLFLGIYQQRMNHFIALELSFNEQGQFVEHVGICFVPVPPDAHLRQSRLTATIINRMIHSLRTVVFTRQLRRRRITTHQHPHNNCSGFSAAGTPVVSSESRGRGAITCRDASARPGTHHPPYVASKWERPVKSTHSRGSSGSVGRGSRGMEDDRGEEEGRQEAGEVWGIVGFDSRGQCQASFRIHSLRSSCYIFYGRRKEWLFSYERILSGAPKSLRGQKVNRRLYEEK